MSAATKQSDEQVRPLVEWVGAPEVVHDGEGLEIAQRARIGGVGVWEQLWVDPTGDGVRITTRTGRILIPGHCVQAVVSALSSIHGTAEVIA